MVICFWIFLERGECLRGKIIVRGISEIIAQRQEC